MRKKSHISLAKYIVNTSDQQTLDKHKKAFYFGSILPDCKPSFLTKRHEMDETFDIVKRKMDYLTNGFHNFDEHSTRYFTRLGEVTHYIADYFTFPHNKEYPGNMRQHCEYEGRLKHMLREYIANLSEEDFLRWKDGSVTENGEEFQSVSDICEFICSEHVRYIGQQNHSVEEDCRYIVSICCKIVISILQISAKSMESYMKYTMA